MGKPKTLTPVIPPVAKAPVPRPVRRGRTLNPFRRQPPVHSPVPPAAVIAASRTLVSGTDPRPMLATLLCREYSAARAILCASGTTALELAITAAVRRAGGRAPVALPAFTCYDVATAAVGADARIALYDVDPATLGPDLDSLERVLRAGARVIVVAHLYGLPVRWSAVERLAAAYGATLIEDAAQGHGARWRGKPLGSLGTIGVLSFGRGKGWTGGGGGAVLLRSASSGALEPDEPSVPLPVDPGHIGDWTMLGRVWAQWALGRPALYGAPASIPWLGLGETRFRPPVTPFAMHRFTAALLLRSRNAARREARARRRNGSAMAAALAEWDDVVPSRAISTRADAGFLRLPARVPGGLEGLRARELLVRLGVAPSYPTTLAELPEVAARLVATGERLVGASALARELITFPTHSLLSDRDRQQVLHLLNIDRDCVQ